jgi:hypothetical protein
VDPDFDRLLALVRRELGATETVVLEDDADAAHAAGFDTSPSSDWEVEMRCPLPDGRSVVARFDAPVADPEVRLRRMEILVNTFTSALGESVPAVHGTRPPAAVALQDELQKLRTRAAAINVVVIDDNSPVVWGAAVPEGLATNWYTGSGPEWQVSGEPSSGGVLAVSRTAVDLLRSAHDASRKGKHARHIERGGEVPFLAHSFAGIYWLLLVYSAPFDELRAERAVLESLPRVERLVMALPPMDPSPEAGARAMVRPRRR